jgi:UPF0755 protein
VSGLGERTGRDGVAHRPAPEPAAARGTRRRVRQRRRRRVVVLTVGAVLLLLIGFVAWYELEANPLGAQGAAVVLTVSPNESADAAIGALASHGVVASSLAFRISDIVHGTPTVQPGSYLFHQNQSFSTVRSILSGGPDVFDVDVVPGLTLAEVGERISELPIPAKGSFAAALASPALATPYAVAGSNNLEGTVAPGTYQVLPGETVAAIVGQMRRRFDREASSLDLEAAAQALGVTPAQLVIVASVVEKEGVYEKNMGKVARVIYNRLARGMPLQMDSTVLYSLGQDGGPVTAADLAMNTPYNTYLHVGLPPTAICTPSLEALEAAAHPTPGAWLYFQLVSKDGTEQFSDTYDGQLAAEALAKSRGLP